MASTKKWTITFKPKAAKQFKKLDKQAQILIRNFLRDKLQYEQDPRRVGAPLKGEMGDFWRYRIADYRLICNIQDQVITIEILKIGHRKDVYKR